MWLVALLELDILHFLDRASVFVAVLMTLIDSY